MTSSLPLHLLNIIGMALVFGNEWGERNFRHKMPPYSASKWKGKQERHMCSTKFCDNFLMQLDIFFHFRGLLLWNSKNYQFQHKNKNKNVRTPFRKSSMPFYLPFYKIMELLTPMASQQCFAQCNGCIVIFEGWWMKTFFAQIRSCMKVFILKKLGAPMFYT